MENEIDNLFYNLSAEEIEKLLELQTALVNERNHCMTIEEIITFLRSAMNFGEFQLTLFSYKIDGIELSLNEMLKKFLNVISIEQILGLYDILQNFNEVNLENLRERKNPSNR